MRKEHPILFSTEMVKAILKGRKTMTRRIIKPQPFKWMQKIIPGPYKGYGKEGDWIQATNDDYKMCGLGSKCRYGKPGDWLWVRESFEKWSIGSGAGIYYKADHPNPETEKWKPSIHLKKDDVRIWLEVIDIRVERVQDITHDEIVKEGTQGFLINGYYHTWKLLWEKINGKGSWEQNPWVWVIEFKVLSTAGKPND